MLVPASMFSGDKVILNTLPDAQVAIVKPLTAPKVVSLAPVAFMPYHYDPMGTHPNPFPYGQCTYGAASMKGNITWSGNANQWDDQARARGIPVKSEPIVGAVAVENAGEFGHVAVVTGVGDGTVTVTEMNFDWNGGVRSYTYPTSHFDAYLWM